MKKFYLQQSRDLESQPREIETMKAQELARLNQELQQAGNDFRYHIQEEINEIVTNGDMAFEEDFQIRQTLQQTSQGFDAQSIIEAEPAIRK